jgi:hypothetical protein
MKQYRPNVERQKWLYSMEKSRILMRRRQGKPPVNMAIAQGKKQIPDNSEPWLPGGVRSVADAIWISDRIQEDMERWKIPARQTD